MATPVCLGATLQCTMGAAPSSLVVIPMGPPVMVENKLAATTMDNKPFANILPFGVCNSILNPPTASATAAALGVLTPGPCIPNTPAPWVPGAPTVMVNNKPMLDNTSKLMCIAGGTISVQQAGATKETIP